MEERMQMRIVTILSVMLMVLAVAASALAKSPSQTECEEAGGTFDRTQGTVTCTFVEEDPVGQSEASGGHSQTTTTTDEESSKGTLKNEPQHEETSECVGPGNSGPGGGPCP
jgi:hypothetical protein